MPETFQFTGGASVSVDDIIQLINNKGHSHLLPLHVNSPNFPIAIERLLLVVQEMKIKGNEHFKRKDFPVAVVEYDKAVDEIKWLTKEWVNAKCNPDNKPTLLEKVKAVQNAMTQCYNNTAIALSKMKRHAEVIEVTTKVLDIHPQNEKALFRRAEAALAKQDFAMSLSDIRNYNSIVTNLNAEAKNIRSLAKKGLKMQSKLGPRQEDAPPILVQDASSSEDTEESTSEDPDFMDADEYSSDGSAGPPPLKGLKGAKGKKGKGKGKSKKKSGSASSKPPALMDGSDDPSSKKKKKTAEQYGAAAAAAGAKGGFVGQPGFPGKLTPNLEQLMKNFTNQSAKSGVPIEEYLMNLTAEEQKHIWSLVGGSAGPMPPMRQDSDSSDGEMPPLKAAAPEGKKDRDDDMPPLKKDKSSKKSSPKAADDMPPLKEDKSSKAADEAPASTAVVEAPREKRKKGEKKKKAPSLVMADSDSSSSYDAMSDSAGSGDDDGSSHTGKAKSSKKGSKSGKGKGDGVKADQVDARAKAQAAKEAAQKAEKQRQAEEAARVAAAEAKRKEESERVMRELLEEEERERRKRGEEEVKRIEAEMRAQKEKEKKEEKKKKKEAEAAQKKAEEEERKAQQARIRAETERVKRERERAEMEEAERIRAEQLRQEAEAKKMEEAERQQKEEAMLEEAREMMMMVSLAGEKGGKQLTESKMKEVRKMRKKVKKLEHECEEGNLCVREECWFVHPFGRQKDLQKVLEKNFFEAENAAKEKEVAASSSKKTAAAGGAGGAKEAGMDLKSERELECDAGRKYIDAKCPRKHVKGREMDDEAEARRIQEDERRYMQSVFGISDDALAAGAAPAAASSTADVVTAGEHDQVTAGGPAKTAGEKKDDKKDNWEIDELNECQYCFVEPKEYCFNPCGHLQYCAECWKNASKVARTGRKNHKDVAKDDKIALLLECWVCFQKTVDDPKERMIHKHEAIRRGIKVWECSGMDD